MSGDPVRQTLASLIRQYHAEGSVSGATTRGGAHRRGAHPTCTNRWCVAATDALVASNHLDPDRLAHALEDAIGNYRGIDDLAAKTVARYAAIHQQDTDRAAR